MEETESAKAGVGQLTSFNQLGFRGIKDRPDGWYLPNETYYPALVLEVKSSNIKLGDKEREDYFKFLKSGGSRYPIESLKIAGVNMEETGPVQDACDEFKKIIADLENLLHN